MHTKARINQTLIELVKGDITLQDTEAIVNAANSSLLGGGGVDGAIHRAAGPELLEETRQLNGCPTGDARLTQGYRLPAKYVIHAVGPIYRGSRERVDELLASAYRRSLEIAAENRITSIAFPSISTGAYGYPLDEATPIALQTVCDFAAVNTTIEKVRFVLFDERTFQIFQNTLEGLYDTRNDLASVEG